ncbi:MAG: class I SAM-dependent methyltransferase [Syntrophales bacterium]|nr:class I SAM-dependent methyltransferase [Syntrophales bacterium]
MAGFLHRWLAHPLTRGMDIDDPQTTALRLQIIRSKPFLRKLYEEWYRDIATHFPSDARVLELGSGAGFLKEFVPQLITSELFSTPGVERVIDAQAIAMAEASLDGIVMTDVLHHIPDCSSFFHEAARVIRPGGRVVMIEPWNTTWSRWVYQHLHHELFEPDAREWRIPLSGPLSGANGALPWIIFQRDRALFEARHPQWRIVSILPIMPFAYLLSGGVSLRNFLPGWMYQPVRFLEQRYNEAFRAMFAVITLLRIET